MPYINIDTDIDIDEFIDQCSVREKQQIIDYLDFDCNHEDDSIANHPYFDQDWYDKIKKILYNKPRLTIEEEKIILEIVNRL